MEHEKRKIEFWSSSDDIWEAVHDNCTNQKPLQAPVEVSVKIADKNGVYKDLSMSYIVDQIEEALRMYGFIRNSYDIRAIAVVVTSSTTQGIIFSMQEVE
jgi:predicted naringenin-chalcone synthase